jgi:transposase
MARHRLADEEWLLIAEIFPQPAATGRPPVHPREMLDGILWRLRTGSPWRDLPDEFGPWKTVYNHYDAWNSNGLLDEVKRRLLQRIVDEVGVETDLWCVDGTVVRAARCAGGGGKKRTRKSPAIMR